MAKILGFILLFILAVLLLVVLIGQLGLLKGRQPDDLGVRVGKLKPPSATPNSVSSQAALYPNHPQKDYANIEPLHFSGNPQQALERLAVLLKAQERTELVAQSPEYLYARCYSRWLKFTDDLEFWLDLQAGVIQVRSASRLGRKDFGVNRARVEKIRAQFEKN